MKRLISIVAALAIIGIAAAQSQTQDQVEFKIEVQGDAALQIVPPDDYTNVEIDYFLDEDGQWRTTEGLKLEFSLRYFSNKTADDDDPGTIFTQDICVFQELPGGQPAQDSSEHRVCEGEREASVGQLVPHYITVKAGQVGEDAQLAAVPAFLNGALEMIVTVDSDDGEVSCAYDAFVNQLTYTPFAEYFLPGLPDDYFEPGATIPDWAIVHAAGPSDEQIELTKPFLGTAGQDVRVAFNAVDVDLVGVSSDRTTGLRGAYCGTDSAGGATVVAEIDMADDKLIPEGEFPVQLVFTLNEYSDSGSGD